MLVHQWTDAEELNRNLAAIIIKNESESTGEQRSNAGGWHSTGDFERWAGQPGHELIRGIGEAVNAATRACYELYKGRDPIRWRSTIWANVNRRGNYNRGHIQPNVQWSGVYYVDEVDSDDADPGSGLLVLQHPNVAVMMGFFAGLNPDHHAFRPRAGMIIVFPSYLAHDVQPYGGERPRISIAFNAKRELLP